MARFLWVPMCALFALVALPACTSLRGSSEPEPSAFVAPADTPSTEIAGPVEDFGRVGLSSSHAYYLPQSVLRTLPERLEAARASLLAEPLNSSAFKTLAYDALSRANPDGALVYLHTSDATQDPEWLMLAGVAHLMRGDADEGLAFLMQSSNAGMSDGLADFNMGVYHYVRGNNASALASFRRALAATPRNPTVRLYAGCAAFSLRDHRQAEEHLVMAAKGARDSSLARYNLGLVYRSGFRDLPLARQVFRALMDDPNANGQVRALALGALENIERQRGGMPELAMVTSLEQ